MDAFENYDYQAARALATGAVSSQGEMDKHLKHLMECIFRSRQDVAGAVNFVLLLRSLERGLRHVQNIAEHIIYLVTGEDLRHR